MLKVAVVGGKSMLQPKDDIEAIEQSLSESAAFLLPLARESSWPCKPELLGWLTMVRDTLARKMNAISIETRSIPVDRDKGCLPGQTSMYGARPCCSALREVSEGLAL